jgi:hypothetical protein
MVIVTTCLAILPLLLFDRNVGRLVAQTLVANRRQFPDRR